MQVVIDFGLASTSDVPAKAAPNTLKAHALEDRAVDLALLERALLATHRGARELFTAFMQRYVSTYEHGAQIEKQLNKVRARGRKRSMVG